MERKPARSKTAADGNSSVQEPSRASFLQYLPYGITLLFGCLSLAGILRHELWRDEYQAWMVTVDASSIKELLDNLKYDGHPVLWYFILYAVSIFTDDPLGMQLVHILISAAMIFVVHRHAPLSIVGKVLFTFGYFAFFEYNLISRNYGIGLLLVVSYCAMFPARHKNILLMGIVLMLLANASIFGTMLAACLGGIIFLEYFISPAGKRKNKIPQFHLIIFCAILAVGIVTALWFILPEADNTFPALYVTRWDPERLQDTFERVIYGYFPLPDITTFHFWNTNLIADRIGTFNLIIAPLLILTWLVIFIRNRRVAAVFAGGTLLLLAFYYYSGFLWQRYAGHVFILVFACWWLLPYMREDHHRTSVIQKLVLVGKRIERPVLLTMLTFGFSGGIFSYVMDMVHPFSTSGAASSFLLEKGLDKSEIVGTRDFVVSPIASQLRRKIYYAESKQYGSFVIYDKRRTNIASFSEVESILTEKWRKERRPVILIKDFPVYMIFQDTGERVLWEDALLNNDLHLKLLTHISPGIVEDETYYIYAVDPVR